jgi:hypothetical protein
MQSKTINSLSSLNYLRADCHKQAVTHIRESRRFESMYTLQGIPDTHDTYAFCAVHVCHTYTSNRQFPYVATFHADPTELDRFTTPKKKMG